jgi:hypothetical protein
MDRIGANRIEEEQFVTEVMETYQYFVVQHLLFPVAKESKDVFNEPVLAYFIAWYFYHAL